MRICKFLSAGHSAALTYAVDTLKSRGYCFASEPSEDVTHLLLPVPSFGPDGDIKGSCAPEALLQKLPADIAVIGGMLDHPALEGYRTIDLLQDPLYIAQNANITAHCAIKLAMNKLKCTLEGFPTLVIGWGRIGKCLCTLLRGLGAEITVAARKEADRAMLTALGFTAVSTAAIDTQRYRLIFNTAPATVLQQCPGDAVKIDLASKLGIGGLDVIWARGLPGKDAPETSGKLIADTVIRLTEKE